MLVQGQVTDIKPPHNTDKWGNQYQWVTVNTQAGPIIGVKASKNELTQNFIGQNVEWDCIQEQGNEGTYNKFKRPPQQNQSYGSQQPQQGTQQAAQQPNASPQGQDKAVGMVRHGVVCAYISAGVEPDIPTVQYWTDFIMTGQTPPPPNRPQGPIDDGPAF